MDQLDNGTAHQPLSYYSNGNGEQYRRVDVTNMRRLAGPFQSPYLTKTRDEISLSSLLLRTLHLEPRYHIWVLAPIAIGILRFTHLQRQT